MATLFFDSHGYLWATVACDSACAEAFGPVACSRRVPIGVEASRALLALATAEEDWLVLDDPDLLRRVIRGFELDDAACAAEGFDRLVRDSQATQWWERIEADALEVPHA